MSRIIHKFKYRNKFFRAGELTVGDYMISIRDPEYFIEKVLTEFNDKIPKLTQRELEAFTGILFGKEESFDILPKKKVWDPTKDFHVMLGMFMKITGQWYLDVCAMPLTLFNKMLEDIEIISGSKEYDKNRNDKTVDKKKLKEVFGTNTAIK